MKVKRLLAIVLTLCMLLGTTAFSVLAEETNTTISSLEDFVAFRDAVNGGNTYAGQTVTLAADIDLSTIADWIPIGNGERNGSGYTGNAFSGVFDGGNRTISNLTISSGTSSEAIGLFGVVDGGTVKKLTLTDVNINASSNKNAGAAIGLMVGGATADSITVSGLVSAADGVGGVIGRMTISGTVSNCVNSANVSGAAAGGIVGKAYYTGEGVEMNISNCRNSGTITGTASGGAGGIVGFSATNISGCTNNGTITSCADGVNLGGIVGWQQMYGEISDNTNNGSVTSDYVVTTAGGIVGWANYQYKTDGTAPEYPNYEVISVTGNTNNSSIVAANSSLGSGGIVGGAYNAVSVTGNTNYADAITGSAFAAGILGNYQNNDANGYNGDAKTLTVTDNTTYTKIENISANCTNVVCYDNVFYSTNDYTLTNTVVTETPVAEVGGVKYTSAAEALLAAANTGAAEVKFLTSVKELLTTDLDVILKADMTITADSAVTVDFYNNGTNYDLLLGGTNGEDLTIAENVTLTVSDRIIWIGYHGNNIDVIVNGKLIGGSQLWFGGDVIVSETGTVGSKGEALVGRRDAKLTVNGGTLDANYFSLISGTVELNNATATTGPLWLSSNSEGAGSIILNNSNLTSTGNLKMSGGASVTVTGGSALNVTSGEYGASVIGEGCALTIDTSSSVTTNAITGTGAINIDASDFNGTAAPVLNTAGMSGFTGNVSVVNSSNADFEIGDDGKITIIEKEVVNVVEVNGVGFTTLTEAAAAAQAGDEIVVLADVTEDVTVPSGVIFNGNGKQVSAITAAGEITFKGHTKATSFGTQYTNTTINIGVGACLEITGTGRLVIGHGCTFNIEGNIIDAKTANVAELTPSLIMPGASFTGAGVTFNVKNAYIKTTASYCSSSKSASGTFDFNIENSIWEQFGKFAMEAQSENATCDFNLIDSVMTTTSHLVFGLTGGNVVIDNSVVNEGVYRQLENRGNMTIKNGSVVYASVATSSNAKNPGTTIVDNATYKTTGEFSGSDLGTGTLIVKNGAKFSTGKITKANITIDAEGLTAGEVDMIDADLSGLAGEISVINNTLGAKIENGKIVLIEKPVAKIGDVEYTTIADAIAAAQDGDIIKLLADATIDVTTNIKTSITIDGDGKKITQSDVFASNAANAVFDIMNGATVTFNNVTFDGIKNVAVMRTVSANVVIDNCVVSNCTQTVDQGLLRLALGNAKITNSQFVNNNCAMVISFGYDAANETDILTMDGCLFEGNTCNGPAVVYFADGDKGTITNTKFIDNTVTSAGNAATLYMGWGDGFEVSGCLFDSNDVTTTHATTKRFASAIFADGCKIENNIFLENSATRNGEEIATTVAVAAYYGEASVSSNYWNGGTPSYTVEYDRNEVEAIDYYTSYNAETGTLADKKEMIAKVGNINYATLKSAFAAAKNGDTITLLDDIAVDSETYTIADGTSVTLDMNGKKITVTDSKNGTNSSANYDLFYIYGEMTVTGNGTIELTSLYDRDWNAMSAIFHNRGGVLTIKNGTYKNLGGTDMAWVVDNSGNYYGDATTNIEDGTLESTYTAIRNRMEQNSHGASGTAILNISGGTISGTTSAVWAQAASTSETSPATGEINVTGGNVGIINTARSTGAVCMTTVSGGTVSAFKGEVGELTVTGGTIGNVTMMNAAGETVDFIITEDGLYIEAPAVPVVAKIGDLQYTTLQEALDEAAAGTGNVTVEIISDIDLTGVDWNPVTVSAPGYPVVTVNGNDKTITGLNDMLFAGTWAGGSGLIINNLTIKDSNIEHDVDDAAGNIGVGAFIGYPQASAVITLNDCHLVDSTVNGGHWTGGLIGMAGGYNGNDGPVFMNLTITGCSVTGSTVTGKGSAGGVIGHGSCAAWTNVVIENTTVSGNTVTSTGSSTNKAGAVMGTIGAAGQAATANGETKTGGASVSAIVSDNTVTSNGTAITTIYGRQGTETGKLVVSGGTYEHYPIEENVSYANPADGYIITENADGTYGVEEAPKGTLSCVYTSATGYWGECGGNAKESFEFKFYNDDTYMGYTSLNNVGGIINGNVYVSWNIKLDAASNTDPYWTMAWEVAPTVAMQPNRVEQWVDGVKVAECAVQPNWSDSIFPVVAAVTDADGKILSYVNNREDATLANALANGGNITLLRDVSESLTAIENVTLNGNNVTLTNTYTDDYVNFNNVTVGSGVTLNIANVFSSGSDSDNIIEGTLNVSGVYYHSNDAKTIIQNGGNVTTGGMTVMRYNTNSDSGIYIYGDNNDDTVEFTCNGSSLSTYSGTFYAENAVINTNMLWLDYKKNSNEESDSYAQINAQFVNSKLNVASELRLYKDASLTLEGTAVTAGKVQIRQDATPVVTMDSTSSIKATSVENLAGATLNAVLGEDGTVTFKTLVAKIGDATYTSLQAAFDAAQDGDTITVLENIDLDGTTVTIPAGVDAILDLNGKTISDVCNVSQGHMIMVTYGANLTIKDSSTEKEGKITYASGTSNVGWTIDVEGNLVLESGTIELTGSWSIGYAVDVRPNAWGTAYTEPTTFVMNGGNIVSSDGAVRVASSSSDTYPDVAASFTMNDGKIDAAWDGIFVQQSNAAWDTLSLTINGGTIESDLNPVRFYGPAATSYVNSEDCVDIKLNGGTLTYTGTEEQTWMVEGILRIGGGVTAEDFMKDATVTASASFAQSNVAEGYKWVESNGVYTLENAEETANPFKDAPLFLAGLPDETVDGVTYHPVYMATSIDSLNYRKVGFDYIFQIFDPETGETTFEAPYTTETSEVYNSISDANTTYTVDSIGGNGEYLFMNKLLFDNEYYHNDNTKITITPYAIDMNGNKITGWTIDMTNEYYKELQSGAVKQDMFKEAN